MRNARNTSGHVPTSSAPRTHTDWQVLRTLLPYLWDYRGRVLLALACLAAAKFANVSVPLVLKAIVDALAPGAVAHQSAATVAIVLPIGLLAAYGALRLATTAFTELREYVFAKVTQAAVRKAALQVFRHLHALSLRFHLGRQTGGVTRDIERGTRGISSLVSYTLYSILPTLVEFALIIGILVVKYDIWFAGITVVALTTYIVFTVVVTEWRTHFRRTMNELDSKANTRAIDALINYETVKYFGNEEYEARRYDEHLTRWQQAAIRSQTSLSLLNTGQSAIIALAVTAMMWRATLGVVAGTLTLGDLVLVNAFMIQLYIPLNFLGVIYREIKQSIADMERMFTLLEQNREVADRPDAKPLVVRQAEVRFENVSFAYDHLPNGQPKRQILFNVDFVIPAGRTVAVVGHSGSGKSTLARLLFRFYDVDDGHVLIDGQDIRDVTQASLRAAIGIVPQDTVLFNDTIEYNIAYGRPNATHEDIVAAAKAAHIHDFIVSTPDGYATIVGERGLKLSGGEKQRVAIARTLLKNPPILILDEATSALDSKSEQAIQRELKAIARHRTALVIAHRLSTIADADEIVVLDQGRIAERGPHAQLLARGGLYAQMWALQQSEPSRDARAA
ncbi:MAG TPA: ABC transporter ATP-binding protein/permease [Burkholderiaceae bacterium]|nr:ABC transporter ATP-binding protein/permease [Burkholderiaceae bacterium]